MAQATIKTGIRGLDADLQALFEAASGERLQDIKGAIANPQLTEDQLFAIVPKAIFRVVVGLRQPSTYAALMENVPKEARPYLEKAKEVAEKHFLDLLTHPAVVGRLSPPGARKDTSSLAGALNVITAVRHIPGWGGSPPKMRPWSRLVFVGLDDKVLLDSACDWDDMLGLVEHITDALACEMTSGKALAELQLVEVPDRDKIAERLKEIDANLKVVKQLSRLYGVEVSGSHSSESPSDET